MVFLILGYIELAVILVAVAVKAFAFINALLWPAARYTAANKLTKPAWLAILGLGFAAQLLLIQASPDQPDPPDRLDRCDRLPGRCPPGGLRPDPALTPPRRPATARAGSCATYAVRAAPASSGTKPVASSLAEVEHAVPRPGCAAPGEVVLGADAGDVLRVPAAQPEHLPGDIRPRGRRPAVADVVGAVRRARRRAGARWPGPARRRRSAGRAGRRPRSGETPRSASEAIVRTKLLPSPITHEVRST